MAALPQNNTSRFFLDYTTGRVAHTAAFRLPDIPDILGDFQQTVLDFLTTLLGFLPDNWAVTGGRVQPKGSNVTLPVPLGPLDGFGGGNAESIAPYEEARETAWEGRDPITGRRVSISIYGLIYGTPAGYRFPATTGPIFVANSIGVLQAGEPAIVTISGNEPLWADYVNVQFNSHWEAEFRTTTPA